MLLRAPLHAGIDMLHGTVLTFVVALENKEVGIVTHYLRIDIRRGTTTERQVIDGIKGIGLTLAVMPDETIYLRREV
jgi:hypothetical protein